MSELSINWKRQPQHYDVAELTHPDQQETKLDKDREAKSAGLLPKEEVTAYRFNPTTAAGNREVALVVGGVHSKAEPEGADAAQRLLNKLTERAAKGGQFKSKIIFVPKLFREARFKVDSDGDARQVYFAPRLLLDTNRTFPRPGETYKYSYDRGQAHNGRELIDIYDQNISNYVMAVENRILIQLMELEKVTKALSIHSHSPKKVRGDDVGIFVDPRGGFCEFTDRAYTPEGQADDKLALDMLEDGLRRVSLLKDRSLNTPTESPFRGNILPDIKRPWLTAKNVHYATGVHNPGSSLGMWAPVPSHVTDPRDKGRNRVGATTITCELPRSGKELKQIIDIHVDLILKHFLRL